MMMQSASDTSIGATMDGRKPGFGWTHARNIQNADDLAASWANSSYRGRPSVVLPQAPLAESYGTQWIKKNPPPTVKREFKNWYLPNYTDLVTTPVKNYHPKLTGYEELLRTCYRGRGKDYPREDMSWAIPSHPAGAFWHGTQRAPVRLEPGAVPADT